MESENLRKVCRKLMQDFSAFYTCFLVCQKTRSMPSTLAHQDIRAYVQRKKAMSITRDKSYELRLRFTQNFNLHLQKLEKVQYKHKEGWWHQKEGIQICFLQKRPYTMQEDSRDQSQIVHCSIEKKEYHIRPLLRAIHLKLSYTTLSYIEDQYYMIR